MFIRIPIPRGVGFDDVSRLRSHAAWYHRQVERFGPTYGARRRARDPAAPALSRRRHLAVATSA